MVLADIILFFCGVIGDIFSVLDNNYIDYFSILDIFIAIMFFEKTIHFIMKIITTDAKRKETINNNNKKEQQRKEERTYIT